VCSESVPEITSLQQAAVIPEEEFTHNKTLQTKLLTMAYNSILKEWVVEYEQELVCLL
jgi:hypothetical protein